MSCLNVSLSRIGGATTSLEMVCGVTVKLSRKGGLKCRLSLVCSPGKDTTITIITFNDTAFLRNDVAVGYEQ